MAFDLLIIGGGINGAGIARDAAGRGLKVLLCEKSDLASATSSASTKLIHGGLRYLEQYEFRLVRESLSEREVLWGMAPHIVWPLRFVLPHNPGLRPAWLIRLGLFLYDHIGGRKLLPASRGLNLRDTAVGAPLKPEMTRAFEYSDCWVDDARLVVLNALDASGRGAVIKLGTEVVGAVRRDTAWSVTLRDHATHRDEIVSAKVIVNAGGPWSSQVANAVLGVNSASRVRLVKGSHIVVPRIFAHERAYIFQNADKRIIFAIPYETDFTLIGTTDVECQAPEDAKITYDEIAYLCSAVSAYFEKPVVPEDVVWTYSGVRPLYDDGDGRAQSVTRDYKLERHGPASGPTMLNVFGGKLTTYRKLAEDVLERIGDCFPDMGPDWTAGVDLPGGDFPTEGFDDFVAGLGADYPGVSARLLKRLARAYGTRARVILGDGSGGPKLGPNLFGDLYESEANYLADVEWARSAADVLWRRSKLGLRATPMDVETLDRWFAERALRSGAIEGSGPGKVQDRVG